MKKPEEKSEDKKTPKRLFIKIPKDFYTSSESEQDAFDGAIFDQLLNQVKESNDEQRKE